MNARTLQTSTRSLCALGLVVLAATIGLALLGDSLSRSSATYDEVLYLKVACKWLRTGDDAAISRVGSPLTFWKLQQAPALFLLDRCGYGAWIDDPEAHQSRLLPIVRLGALWVWLAATSVATAFSWQLYGRKAAVLASFLFVLSPNLLAHGALLTMELPVCAALAATVFLYWRYSIERRARWLLLSGCAAGLAFSCKFTTVLFIPILAIVQFIDAFGTQAGTVLARFRKASWNTTIAMSLFLVAMLATDLLITGFAVMPITNRVGEAHPAIAKRLGGWLASWADKLIETPLPRDWSAFAIQLGFQDGGGWSYLFGQRRLMGWREYYLVALLVKAPIAVMFLLATRLLLSRHIESKRKSHIIPLIMGIFMAVVTIMSKRNYGLRYILPLAPLAIVWISGLAQAGKRGIALASVGLAGMAWAVASCHPHELSYFNVLCGGPEGGKAILADSNLDWGQGARELAKLQRKDPQYRDMTLYYFGDTDPGRYGVEGRRFVVTALEAPAAMPGQLRADSRFIAVSRSLQFGPWGPDGYFRELDEVKPAAILPDHTIAVYRSTDLENRRLSRIAKANKQDAHSHQ